jgi:hypothetical protein
MSTLAMYLARILGAVSRLGGGGRANLDCGP